MADILCPNCGKWNVAGAIRCQYCSYAFDITDQDTSSTGLPGGSLQSPNTTKILTDTASLGTEPESVPTKDETRSEPNQTRILDDFSSNETEATPELPQEPSQEIQKKADEIWPLSEEITPDQAKLLNNLENDSTASADEDESLGSGLPAWLSGVSSSETANEPAPTIKSSTQPFETSNSEIPDWLAGLESAPTQEEKKEEQAVSFDLNNPPEWLLKLQGEENLPPSQSAGTVTPAFTNQEAFPLPDQPAKPFSTDDLPDWLARMSLPEEKAAIESKGGNGGEENEEEIRLAPAELPGWVQSLQPVETVSPASPAAEPTEELVEKVGPLTGLRGVLPPEAFTPDIQKSIIYPIDLQVSEKQRINATLFNNILTSEGKSQVHKKKGAFPLKNAFRVLIACCLILAIWLPLWKGSHSMSSLGYVPTEVKDVEDAIGALNSNSVVLLAVDYEPALSGEIVAVASGTITDLMSKSANLVLISTNPMGQILGEQLLTSVQANQASYSLTDKVMNLGYLAGGVSGLYDLALQPRIITPVTVDQKSAWSQPMLSGIKSLADFSAVIVITDSADTARSWIEQVHPVLNKTPLLMVTSAQVGPMLEPYFDAGQIQGMISGISQAKVFEEQTSFTGMKGSSLQFWDSYQIGIVLAILLIAIGGVYAAVELLITPRKSKEEA